MAKAKKRLTHEECRKAVCFFCLRKGKTPDKYYINETLAEFISRGIFPEFISRRRYLPSGCCSTCSTKVYEFLRLNRKEPVGYIQSDHQNYGWIVDKVHTSRYVEISNELKALPDENLSCTCSICGIARANPIPKDKSGSASATITEPLQNIHNNPKVQEFDTEKNSDDFISNRLPKRRCATELKEGTKLYIERKKFKEQNHVSSVHEEKKLFQCIYCEKSFAEKNSLKTHVLTIHDGKKMKFDTVLQNSYDIETEKIVNHLSKVSNYQKKCESMTELKKMLALDIERKKLYLGKRNKNTEIIFDGVVTASDFQNGDVTAAELKEMLALDIKRKKVQDQTTSVHDGKKMKIGTEIQDSLDLKIVDNKVPASDFQKGDESITELNALPTFDIERKKLYVQSATVHDGKKNKADAELQVSYYTETTKNVDVVSIASDFQKVQVTNVHEGQKSFQCSKCNLRYQTKYKLEKHFENIHEKKPYQCGKCKLRFSAQDQLEEHVAIHERKKLFQCMNCGKSFAQKCNLEQHFKNFHEPKYKCNYCNKSFSQQYSLETHVLSIHEKGKLKCTLCGNEFSRGDRLNDHIKKVHEGKTVNQKSKLESKIIMVKTLEPDGLICDDTLDEKKNLKPASAQIDKNKSDLQFKELNQAESISEENQTCSECNFNCKTKSLLLNHIREVHGTIVPYNCPYCEYKGATKQWLQTHVDSVHEEKDTNVTEKNPNILEVTKMEISSVCKEEKQLFKCITCDESFSQKYTLDKHFENIHEVKILLKCEFCSEAFSEGRQMQNHVSSVHEEKKLFQCIYCEKSFADKNNLKTHVLSIHEEKKSFKCIICNDEFVNKQKFDKHIHEEKFTCEFCNMSFLRDEQLIAHIANVHITYKYKSIKMVSCKNCGSYFQEMKALANHLVIHSQCRSKENFDFLKKHGIFPTEQKRQSSAILKTKEQEEIKREENLDLKKQGNFLNDNKSQTSTILEMKDYQETKRTEEHTKAYLMSILK